MIRLDLQNSDVARRLDYDEGSAVYEWLTKSPHDQRVVPTTSHLFHELWAGQPKAVPTLQQ
jgi:hypothetical protein